MAQATSYPPAVRSPLSLYEYAGFVKRQLFNPWFWLLYLVLFATAILITYRKYLRNKIFWSI